jgi:hypothetical protein
VSIAPYGQGVATISLYMLTVSQHIGVARSQPVDLVEQSSPKAARAAPRLAELSRRTVPHAPVFVDAPLELVEEVV